MSESEKRYGKEVWRDEWQSSRESEIGPLVNSPYRLYALLIFAGLSGIMIWIESETPVSKRSELANISMVILFIAFFAVIWAITYMKITFVASDRGVLFIQKTLFNEKEHFIDYRNVSDIRYNRKAKGTGAIYLITDMPKGFKIGQIYPTIEIDHGLESIYKTVILPHWKRANQHHS